jgi:hypothetical protein
MTDMTRASKLQIEETIEEHGPLSMYEIREHHPETDPLPINRRLDELLALDRIRPVDVQEGELRYEVQNVEGAETTTAEGMTSPEDDFSEHVDESLVSVDNALQEITDIRVYTLSARELLAVKIAQLALRDVSPNFVNDNLAENAELIEDYL